MEYQDGGNFCNFVQTTSLDSSTERSQEVDERKETPLNASKGKYHQNVQRVVQLNIILFMNKYTLGSIFMQQNIISLMKNENRAERARKDVINRKDRKDRKDRMVRQEFRPEELDFILKAGSLWFSD